MQTNKRSNKNEGQIRRRIINNLESRLRRNAAFNAALSRTDSSNPYRAAAVLGWHVVSYSGMWDVSRILDDFRVHLRHSRCSTWKYRAAMWEDTIYVLAPDLWLAVHDNLRGSHLVHVWSTSADAAARQMHELKSAYLLPEINKPELDYFWILSVSPTGVDSRRVAAPTLYLTDDELELHYGSSFATWDRDFATHLSEAKMGISILQGTPGTGKTSYLRHLLHKFRASHRFYYLPTTVYPMLAAPSSVDFWLGENTSDAKLKVVIIEDAETLLMQRGSDNRESLSNLLNLADGFLGAFLKLHVICTVNTRIGKLDPAVVRPGRLLAHRTFNRLTRAEAERLATNKGFVLAEQDSYSLAEIYNRQEQRPDLQASRSVGFNCDAG